MYFVLDLGGSNFRIGWIESLDKLDAIANSIKIRNTKNYYRDSKLIFKLIKEKSSSAKGIVVAVPGHFDNKQLVLDGANNLKSWINKPFFKQLAAGFGGPLIVKKDSALAAIGEGVHNKLPVKDFLYLTWGTGIGGCRVFVKTGYLPQITQLDWKRTFGRIETLCSGGHAMNNFGVELNRLDRTKWQVLIGDFVHEVEKICNQLHVGFVVLGGGVTAKRGDVVRIIKQALKKRHIELIKSPLGDYSAIYGGYTLLQSKFG